jgi:hypothetical protein
VRGAKGKKIIPVVDNFIKIYYNSKNGWEVCSVALLPSFGTLPALRGYEVNGVVWIAGCHQFLLISSFSNTCHNRAGKLEAAQDGSPVWKL